MKIIKIIKFHLLIILFIFSISYFNNKIKNIICSQLNKWICQLYIFSQKYNMFTKKIGSKFFALFLNQTTKSYLICIIVQGYSLIV